MFCSMLMDNTQQIYTTNWVVSYYKYAIFGNIFTKEQESTDFGFQFELIHTSYASFTST